MCTSHAIYEVCLLHNCSTKIIAMHTHTLSPALGNVVVRYAVLDGASSLGVLSEVVSVVRIIVTVFQVFGSDV